jgi:Family of unknown function (DUF6519)/Right handed beta helix region
MSGDYTRFTFDPLKRYSGVRMQQGRVQLDSDWNEEIDILRRRLRTTSLDIMGPLGVPYTVSPNAFSIGLIAGPPADLSIGPGRLYVDGIQIEAFGADGATYNHQPFFPPQLAGFPPPALPTTGDAVVYLDVWQREVTYIEDPALLDVALGGADTTTRLQTVWQLRVDPMQGAACGVPVGEAKSAGRLTTRAIAPPAPDDPCILPPASGYRGLENRLYRIEVHTGGALGIARFKWSRDNGSIVSVVRDIAASGGQTTLSVNRIGRDQFLRFRVGDWVTVTDDHRELTGEPGEMALISNIDEANRQIVLDRPLPTGTNRPFGATAAQIVERHTRVQRWDQTGTTNAVDADGLILTGPGPISLEDGIEVQFSVDPAGGSFRVGDYWVFWARTATAGIEELTNAPPRGIEHHYMQVAAITGLGTTHPNITDCRPPPQKSTESCCTIVVRPGESIQAGIDALPAQGGCVCLKTGVHVIEATLRITRGNIVLEAESPGTFVRMVGRGPALIIGDPQGKRVEAVDMLGIDFQATAPVSQIDGVVTIMTSARVCVSLCGFSGLRSPTFLGIHATVTDWLSVMSCRFMQLSAGIVVQERCEGFEADGNLIEFAQRDGLPAFFGIAYIASAFPCRITDNMISGAMFGVLVNDQPFGNPQSLAAFSIVRDNLVVCPNLPDGNANLRPVAIDVAADGAAVTGNRVRYGHARYIGIRLGGSRSEATDNIVLSSVKAVEATGPLGIQVGDADEKTVVLGGVIAHNTIVGPQHGLLCLDTSNVIVDGNLIEPTTSIGGIAISAQRSISSQFIGNQIRDATACLVLMNGRQNRIASNDCRGGSSGITLFLEAGPEVAANRLDALGLWGIFAFNIAARLDITQNRLVGCAAKMTNIAFAIGFSTVNGEANVAGNEVMDTGSGGNAGATSTADYGIIGDLVLEARVEGNLVTYSNVLSRDPQREDRALVMRGWIDSRASDAVPTLGFAVQMLGNKFVGTGRTALVELRQMQVSNTMFARFERVSFDNNYCSHFVAPVFAPGQGATVWLVGRRAIVMGNHIKATTRSFASVNFNLMPGPYIGNVTAGGTVNHADFPAPATNFNMIAF